MSDKTDLTESSRLGEKPDLVLLKKSAVAVDGFITKKNVDITSVNLKALKIRFYFYCAFNGFSSPKVEDVFNYFKSDNKASH